MNKLNYKFEGQIVGSWLGVQVTKATETLVLLSLCVVCVLSMKTEVPRGAPRLPSEDADFAQCVVGWVSRMFGLTPCPTRGSRPNRPSEILNLHIRQSPLPLISLYVFGDFTISPSWLRCTGSSSDANTSRVEDQHFTLFPGVRLLQLWDTPARMFVPQCPPPPQLSLPQN